MRTLSFIALLLLCAPACAQSTILPAEGKALAAVQSSEAGSQWYAISVDFEARKLSPVTPHVKDEGKLCLIEGTPGSQCAVTRFSADGKQRETLVVTLGGGVIPPPVPVPPVPPGPKPEPTPPPVVSGKRELMIVRESADVTTPLAAMLVKLRNGPSFDYLKAKGHTLSILDKDSVNENGQPSKLVEAWRPHFAGMTLPVLFIIDAQTRQLLHKQSIPPEYTADNIIERLRENGG